LTAPVSTASIAFFAMLVPSRPALVIATNHWSVSIGSTTWPVRTQIGTACLCGTAFSRKCCASRSRSTAFLAS
jgi:hypothetical protein